MLTPLPQPLSVSDSASRADARLREVLALHLDPRDGSAYWLDRQSAMNFDIRREIRSVADLQHIGPMAPAALARRPLLDFVPRALHTDRNDWILAQTGGATGCPVWTVYAPREFEEAFVAPFTAAAAHVGFPRGGLWLYAGPSGPHIIARAARRLARTCDAPEPFSVDFDPRWARKMPAGSFGAQRYLQHVVDQALAVIESQEVTVLFTTPPLLTALAPHMTPPQRDRIRGIHYGGTHLSAAALRDFQTRWFTQAVHLSGYGNTLFGCCLELDVSPGRVPAYFPHGDRLILTPAPGAAPNAARVPLCFSRLDATMLLLNVEERDTAEFVQPPVGAPRGFNVAGARDVGPDTGTQLPAAGLY